MWGRDPLAQALGVETVKAEAESQQIAQAMFAGIVPAGVTQVVHASEARVTVMPMLDQEGNVLTLEMRAARVGTRRRYNPNDLHRNYQAEIVSCPETDYSAPDKFVPQLPRLCRELGAAIRGRDFQNDPLDAGALKAPPRRKDLPPSPQAPQHGGVMGLTSAPTQDPK